MERIKKLSVFQKALLILLAAMALGFAIAYAVVISRVGFLYYETIFVPQTVGTDTVYTGKLYGDEVAFTVTADKAVTFARDGETYGPYTAREDPTAVPEEHELAELMTGVEIRQGGKVFFRGGVLRAGEAYFDTVLFREDGDREYSASISILNSSGNMGYALSVETILELMRGPKLTHKGDWTAWFFGVLFSAVTAVSILFADEIFRWNLSFLVRDPDRAEPSEWQLMCRYISWVLVSLIALATYIMGLGDSFL